MRVQGWIALGISENMTFFSVLRPDLLIADYILLHFSELQTFFTSSGLLGGPPAFFALLIVSFLVFKAISNSQKQAKKAEKLAAKEAEEQ